MGIEPTTVALTVARLCPSATTTVAIRFLKKF